MYEPNLRSILVLHNYGITYLHSPVKSNGKRYSLDGGCELSTLFIPFELYKEFIDVITTRSWNIHSYFGMNNMITIMNDNP